MMMNQHKRKKFGKNKRKEDGGNDGNVYWVSELGKLMNEGQHLEPVYSMVQRHHLFTSSKKDHCQVTVQYGSSDKAHTMMKRDVDYKTAQTQVAKSACNKLKSIKVFKSQVHQPVGEVHVPEIPGLKLTKDGLPSLSTMGRDALDVVHECGKFMSNDVLATLFKDLLHLITTQIKRDRYEFNTELEEVDDFVGYTSTLFYNRTNFQSLGVMVDENQAEQSAAEVCLRNEGFLPSVSKEEYTIQPYQGGLPYHVEGIVIDQPWAFTSNLLSDVFEAFCFSYELGKPQYYVKKGDPEAPASKEAEDCDCMCWVGGKSFHSPFPHTDRVARQFTAYQALQHYGMSRLHQSMELRKYINLNKYDFRHACVTIRIDYRPSLRKGWLQPRFFRPEISGNMEVNVEDLISSDILDYIIWDKKEYVDSLVRAEVNSAPAFRGKLLSELTDISVAEIDVRNSNLFVIGNSYFSIKMLTDNGKIYCRKQDADIKLLPGHNIQKLLCEYRLSLPSLEIYIKAIACEDLNHPRIALPVVTSCGVVVLYHDFEASPEDVFVLLTQRMSGLSFESQAGKFVKLLKALVNPQLKDTEVTPKTCTKGIRKWLYKEVKLLSEMTWTSVSTLVSLYYKWNVQWNKLFTQSRLPRPLQGIQNICLDEVERRDKSGLSEEDGKAEVWDLPQSEFVTVFDTIGIHLEDSIFTARRGLSESGGIKLTPTMIEDSTVIDIPVKSDGEHRGDVCRYYIWSEIYEGKIPNTLHQEMLQKGYTKYGDLKWLSFDHGRTQYVYKFAKTIADLGNRKLSNITYLNADGSRTPYIEHKQAARWERETPNKKKRAEEEEEEGELSDQSDEEAGDIDERDGRRYQWALEEDVRIARGYYVPSEAPEVEEERGKKRPWYEVEKIRRGRAVIPARDAFRQYVVWKKLDQAINVCPMLMKISQTNQFIERLKSVIEDANKVVKDKGFDKTVRSSLLPNIVTTDVEVKIEKVETD